MTKLEHLRELALAGVSRAEAARTVGLSYGYVKRLAPRADLPFRHGNEKAVVAKPRQVTPIQAIKTSGILRELSLRERADTLTLIRKGGYSAADALRAIGRHELAERLP